MAEIIIYTKETCPYCYKAKQLLDSKNLAYTELRIDLHPELRNMMIEQSGRHTVPQIFINGQSIGGCDDLHALENQGRLQQLLEG